MEIILGLFSKFLLAKSPKTHPLGPLLLRQPIIQPDPGFVTASSFLVNEYSIKVET